MAKRLSGGPPPLDRPELDAVSTDGRPDRESSGIAILLVEDNPAVFRAMEIALNLAGHRLEVASGPQEALSRLARRRFDAVLLDMNFTAGATSGDEGLAFLRRMVAHDPGVCVVVITAHSGIRIAVAAMQAGARDFIMKPWRNADLISRLEAAIARGAPASHGRSGEVRPAEPAPVLLGESAPMRRLRDLIARVAATSAGVAVLGRPGSGRTLAARAIHAASIDAAPPVRIDLLRQGDWDRIVDADRTIILRHPDQLDRSAQDRLLERLAPVARCIAVADTVETLLPALRRRIATVEVTVPPLEERDDDAVLLARHFASDAAERFGRPMPRLTKAAEQALLTTAWQDEVRGLALAVERAVVLAEDGVLDAAALVPRPLIVPPSISGAEEGFALTDAEKALIEAALRSCRHNVTLAAAALGLSRGALYRRMAKYGL